MKILGIAGSLRKGSYNRAALRAAQQLAPEGTTIEILDLKGIPPFDQDEEAPLPDAVAVLKGRISAADAILIASPEYNRSIPGVLKNALDWGSRPDGGSAWKGKPVAVMGASPGMLGTARAQNHLRQCFVSLEMPAVMRPEVFIAAAPQKFDAGGNLTDERTRKAIRQLVEALVELAHRYGAR